MWSTAKRILGSFVTLLLGATLLAVFAPTGPATAQTQAKTLTKNVTQPLRIEMKTKETPIPEGGTSYYCAVGAFASFNNIPGWTPKTVTVSYFGDPYSESIGAAPYDDNASINELPFPPVGGRHQTQIGGFSYGQGGTPSVITDCPQGRDRLDSFYGPNATISYTREVVDVSQKCAKAQSAFKKAVAKVRAVQRQVGRLNKQVRKLNADIRQARHAGKRGKAQRLTKQLNSTKKTLAKTKRTLQHAKVARARAGSAAAKACRD